MDDGCELDPEISRALAGNGRGIDWAMEQIYENYWQSLFATALALLGSPQDAEDAVQEALAAFYERVMTATWLVEGSVRSFLHEIVHNKAVDIVRKRKRRNAFLETERKEQNNILTTSTDDTLTLFEVSDGTASFQKFVGSLTTKEKSVAEYLGNYWLSHSKLPTVKHMIEDVGGTVASVKSIRKRLWPKMRKWLAKAKMYEN